MLISRLCLAGICYMNCAKPRLPITGAPIFIKAMAPVEAQPIKTMSHKGNFLPINA
jgi:hypothetical protein